MSLFNAALLSRFSQEAEDDFAAGCPCIVKRVALDIVAGTDTYSLPDDIHSIRRVTWKGIKVDPMPGKAYKELFQGLTITSSQGQPFWYIYNNIGLKTIRLYPAPNDTLPTVTTDLYGASIRTKCILEYFQMPDYSSAIIPTYFRRRLLKPYVLNRCYSIEGKGINMKAASYYATKYSLLKELYTRLLYTLHGKPRRLIITEPTFRFARSVAPPVLPIAKFGESVETGE